MPGRGRGRAPDSAVCTGWRLLRLVRGALRPIVQEEETGSRAARTPFHEIDELVPALFAGDGFRTAGAQRGCVLSTDWDSHHTSSKRVRPN